MRGGFFGVFQGSWCYCKVCGERKDKNWKYICTHPNTPKPETPSASSGSNWGRGVRVHEENSGSKALN